jgi:putative endonuclease
MVTKKRLRQPRDKPLRGEKLSRWSLINVFASPETSHCEERSDEAIQRDIMKQGYTYILFNKRNGTLYTGVTSDLSKRVYEHKNKLADGFTKKYNVDKLGYYEQYNDILQAIEREKQIKAGSRKKKIQLIENDNPEWKDLYEDII